MSNLATELLKAPKHERIELIHEAALPEIVDIFQSDNDKAIDALFAALDHSSLGRVITGLDSQLIQSYLLKASIQAVSHILKIIQSKHLAKILANASNELIGKLIDTAQSRQTRQKIAKGLPIERQKFWLEYIREQEAALSDIKRVTDDSTSSLIEERRRLLKDLDQAVHDREASLSRFDKEMDLKQAHSETMLKEAQIRLHDLQQTIAAQEDERKDREAKLAERIREFEEATNRQVQQRIELKVPEYVAAAVRVLESRETHYRKKPFSGECMEQ